MGTRRELRLGIALTVRLSGVDTDGKSFELDAATIDVTGTGARLSGVTRPVKPGSVLTLKHRQSQAKVQVVWVGTRGSSTQDHIGVEVTRGGQLHWGRNLPRIMGDGFPAAQVHDFNIPIR